MKRWEKYENVRNSKCNIRLYKRYMKCSGQAFNRSWMGEEKFSELEIALSENLWFKEQIEKTNLKISSLSKLWDSIV